MDQEQELLADLWKLLDRHKFQYKIELTVDNHSVTLVSSAERKEKENALTSLNKLSCSYPRCSCNLDETQPTTVCPKSVLKSM